MVISGSAILISSIIGIIVSQGHFSATIVSYWASGIATGAIYPPIIAWMTGGDGTHHRNRTEVSRILVRFCLTWNFGLICGQLGGGILFSLGSYWPSWFALCLSIVNLCLLIGAIEPSWKTPLGENVPAPDTAEERAICSIFTLVSWVASLGSAFSVGLIVHLFPHLVVSMGIPAERHGFMLGIMRLICIATYLIMHRRSFWHYRFSVHVAVQTIALIGLYQVTRAKTELGLVLGLCAVGCLLGFNYFASIYYSTTGSRDREKGLFNGINEGVIALGFFLGSLVGGFWGLHAGPRTPYLLGMGVLTLSIMAQFIILRIRLHPSTPLVKNKRRLPGPEPH